MHITHLQASATTDRTHRHRDDRYRHSCNRTYDNLLRPTGYELKTDTLQTESSTGYTYDNAGRLNTVTSGTDTFSYQYLPNAPQLLEKVTSPVGTATNIYEANRNILDAKLNKLTDNSIVSSFDYSVNALGQRTNVTRSGSAFPTADPISWGYDALGQLTNLFQDWPILEYFNYT